MGQYLLDADGPVPGRLRAVTRPDVVVVGAGIVGAAAARELAVRGVAVTLLDRGEVSGGTTGLGEGNVLCSDKDAGPELELARRRARALRRARGAARRRGADPPQGRADRAPRRGRRWAGEPARVERLRAAGVRAAARPGRGARARAGAHRRAARRGALPGRPAVRSARDRAGAGARGRAAGADVRDGPRGRAPCAGGACGSPDGERCGATRSCSPRARGARALAASAGLALPLEPRKGQLVRLAAPRGRASSATRSSTAPTCARSRAPDAGLADHDRASRRRGTATCSSARAASGAGSTRPSTRPSARR